MRPFSKQSSMTKRKRNAPIVTVDFELERRFEQPDARSAAEAFAKILSDQLEIDGEEAERVIDAHLGT